MTEISENNKRIARNTLLLYARMLFMMLISLYTSRLFLQILGVEDYGIYNVVGGIVSMFSLISGSLSASISRFITFELGRNDIQRLKVVFSTSVNIQICLALFIMVLAEIFGVYFLNYKMNIPPDRMYAANWVLQFSIITFMVNLISVPYNATIIAHEKMGTFAYMSLFEVFMKLLFLYMLYITPFDKLITYSVCLMIISLLVRFIYGIYCKRNFTECTYEFIIDKSLFKSMTGFAGWNFFGSGSYLLMTQGVNILINIFFGVTLNAARGIANQVDSAVNQFVGNFTMAINPQITKYYASGNIKEMHKLVYNGSKYSFFILWILALPILLETEYIMSLWLGQVPEYSVLLLRLTLAISLVSVVSNTLITSMLATGNIKKYQIIVGGMGMLVFILSYISFKIGFSVESAYLIHLFIFILQLVARLFLLRNMIDLNIKDFLKEVILKDLTIVAISSVASVLLFLQMETSFIRFIIICIASFVINVLSILFIGMSFKERMILVNFIKSKIVKKK